MEESDVVIIGSGYGGSIPAARLAEAGMKVVVLERGKRLASSELEQSDEVTYLDKVVELFIAKNTRAFRTGKIVGGASILADGAHYRAPTMSLDAEDESGYRYWPSVYTRAELDPYYDIVEEVLQVRRFDWPEIAKAGGYFAKLLDSVGATCDRGLLNYTDCVGCGFCEQGCIFDKKRSPLHTYIPLAEANGAEFRAGCLADHLEPSGTGYVVAYTQDGEKKEIWGQRVFVAAGGIHSAVILLKSRPWMPNLSDHVGKHLNTNGQEIYVGILPPEFEGTDDYRCYKGTSNAALMCYHYMPTDGFTLHANAGLDPGVFAGALQDPAGKLVPKRSWGMDFKRFAEEVYPHRVISYVSLGLSDGWRQVVLQSDGSPDVIEGDRVAYDAYLDRVEKIIADIDAKTGVSTVPAFPRRRTGTTSAHLLSACRMAESVDQGVVDPDGQVFGYENLYLCDASALPFALAVNPADTISAVAERVSQKVIVKG